MLSVIIDLSFSQGNPVKILISDLAEERFIAEAPWMIYNKVSNLTNQSEQVKQRTKLKLFEKNTVKLLNGFIVLLIAMMRPKLGMT